LWISPAPRAPGNEPASFVGRAACGSCHTAEAALWQGTHHDKGMQEATAQTVLGNFNNATLTNQGLPGGVAGWRSPGPHHGARRHAALPAGPANGRRGPLAERHGQGGARRGGARSRRVAARSLSSERKAALDRASAELIATAEATAERPES